MSITFTSITLSNNRAPKSRPFRHSSERSDEIVNVTTRFARADGSILVVSDDPIERRVIELSARVAGASIEVGPPSSLRGRRFALVALVLPIERRGNSSEGVKEAVAVVGPTLRAIEKRGGVIVDFYDVYPACPLRSGVNIDPWWAYFERAKAFRAALKGER